MAKTKSGNSNTILGLAAVGAIVWALTRKKTTTSPTPTPPPPPPPPPPGTANLYGYITDAVTGEKLPRAQSLLSPLPDAVIADNNGYYVFSAVPPGSYTLQVGDVGYNQANIPVTLVAGNNLKNVALTRKVGATYLHGYVVDAKTGEKLGANLLLVGGLIGSSGTTSDPMTGYYQIGNLPPDNYTLYCFLEGYQDWSRDITIIDGTNVQNIGLEQPVTPQPQPATVSGIITSSVTSQPIAGALVSLATGFQMNTGADGRYSFSGFNSGLFTIIVQATGYEMVSRPVNLVPGANMVDIALSPILTPPPPVGTPGAAGFPVDYYDVNGVKSLSAWSNSVYLPGSDENWFQATNGLKFQGLYGSDEDGNKIVVNWPGLLSALVPYADYLHSYILPENDPWWQEHLMLWSNIRNIAGVKQVYSQYQVGPSQNKIVNGFSGNLYNWAGTVGVTGPITVSFKMQQKPYGPGEGYMQAKLYLFPAGYSRFDDGGIMIPNRELPRAYNNMPFWMSNIILMPENGQTASLALTGGTPPGGIYHALLYFSISNVLEGLPNANSWAPVRIKNLLSF